MKNMRKFIIVLFAFILILPFIISCKKGDGDPFLSIYSRKARLCNDWEVTSIEQTVKYKTTTITTTFDGTKLTRLTVVTDTVFYPPNDTLYEYRENTISTGSIYFTFENTGYYQIDEAFINDTTHAKYTTQEKGIWYFMGGTHDSGTKKKELLGLEPSDYIYNPITTSANSWQFAGQYIIKIYHIYRLAKKELELHFDTEETTNLVTVTTTSKIFLKPK
jgi:hypothetical protein